MTSRAEDRPAESVSLVARGYLFGRLQEAGGGADAEVGDPGLCFLTAATFRCALEFTSSEWLRRSSGHHQLTRTVLVGREALGDALIMRMTRPIACGCSGRWLPV